MDPNEREEVRRTLAVLTAQLDRITKAVEESLTAAEEGGAAPSRPPRSAVAPQGGPLLSVRSQGESVRSYAVVFILTFGLGSIVFAWFWTGIEDAMVLAAILMGLIASIVGFHFGQRGSNRAQTQATFAMRGWQSAEARARQLEDWTWSGEASGGRRE